MFYLTVFSFAYTAKAWGDIKCFVDVSSTTPDNCRAPGPIPVTVGTLLHREIPCILKVLVSELCSRPETISARKQGILVSRSWNPREDLWEGTGQDINLATLPTCRFSFWPPTSRQLATVVSACPALCQNSIPHASDRRRHPEFRHTFPDSTRSSPSPMEESRRLTLVLRLPSYSVLSTRSFVMSSLPATYLHSSGNITSYMKNLQTFIICSKTPPRPMIPDSSPQCL